jgi:hypothetical protein
VLDLQEFRARQVVAMVPFLGARSHPGRTSMNQPNREASGGRQQ